MRALFWTVALVLALIGGASGGLGVFLVLILAAALLSPLLER